MFYFVRGETSDGTVWWLTETQFWSPDKAEAYPFKNVEAFAAIDKINSRNRLADAEDRVHATVERTQP